MDIKQKPLTGGRQKILTQLKKVRVGKSAIKSAWILAGIILLIIGIMIGLIISGYFGTFDQPSGRAYAVLSALGIDNLHDMRILAQGLVRENIRIPINYIRSQISSPEKMIIDIDFEDLQKIEYKRQQAIQRGGLITTDDDWVNAKITQADKTYDVKLRLKGSLPDHWSGSKWSFRIEVKNGEKIWGMPEFSIQDPKTRQEVNEWFFHNSLKYEGLIGIQYKFAEVIINGENKGVYAVEQFMTKEVIESNNRREGLIFNFDNDISFENALLRKGVKGTAENDFFSAEVDTFESTKGVIRDEAKQEQYNTGLNLLENFRSGKLKAHQIFDAEQWGKYYAITTVLNCPHSVDWLNERMYLNPITVKFEPVGYDANCRIDGAAIAFTDISPHCIQTEGSNCEGPEQLHTMILRDPIVYAEYIKALNEYSQEEYINKRFEALNKELKENILHIQKEKPFYYFPKNAVYTSAQQIQDILSPLKPVNAYTKEINTTLITLQIANNQRIPIQVQGINISGTVYKPTQIIILQPRNLSKLPEYQEYTFAIEQSDPVPTSEDRGHVIAQVYQSTYSINIDIIPFPYAQENFIQTDFMQQQNKSTKTYSFIQNSTNQKRITVKSGNHIIHTDIIIPKEYTLVIEKGTTIDLQNNAMILSYGATEMLATKEEPIVITTTDQTGQGFTLMNPQGTSIIEHTTFKDLQLVNKTNWKLTSAVNIYGANVEMNNVQVLGGPGEDTINIVRSDMNIENMTIASCYSDCFDIDFGTGKIQNIQFFDCGNDCLDVSGTIVNVTNMTVQNVGDKAMSAGEASHVQLSGLNVGGQNVFIGAASKDQSVLNITNVKISNANYCLTAYQKKAEYGAARINVENISCANYQTYALIEEKSILEINQVPFLNKAKNVYDTLYPEG